MHALDSAGSKSQEDGMQVLIEGPYKKKFAQYIYDYIFQ
jgi:hypothetical protein